MTPPPLSHPFCLRKLPGKTNHSRVRNQGYFLRGIVGVFAALQFAAFPSLSLAQVGKPPVFPATPGPTVSVAAPPAASPPTVAAPAAPSPTIQPAPSAAAAPTDAQLITDGRNKLVFVEGHEKAGSGFLCDLGGQKFLVTNAHVLAGNTQINFTLLDGSPVRVGAASAAVAHDIVRLAVAPNAAAFSLLDHLDENLRVGDDVLVLGNAEGARVINPISGHVVGIGPNLVEVDAPFLPGNSGSPIIQKRTGKVVGIATYVTRSEDELSRPAPGNDPGTKPAATATPTPAPEVKLRRFGYRIDSVKTWQGINWPVFQADAANLAKVDQLTEDLNSFVEDVTSHKGVLNAGLYQNPVIQRPVAEFLDTMHGHPSPTDSLAARQRLLDALRRASQSDLAAIRPQLRYDYFQRGAQERQRTRDFMSKGFEAAMKAQTNATNR